jgi:hypothetical protein
MAKYLSLNIGGYEIDAPAGIPEGGFVNSSTGNDIVSWALGLAFVIAVVSALVVIVWGGIQWISSEGNKERVAAARNRIVFALVGLVVVILSFAIINFVLYFFGLAPQSEPYANPCGPNPTQPC